MEREINYVTRSMQERETIASISVQNHLVGVGMFETDVCTFRITYAR
jgi:hypothetical protein